MFVLSSSPSFQNPSGGGDTFITSCPSNDTLSVIHQKSIFVDRQNPWIICQVIISILKFDLVTRTVFERDIANFNFKDLGAERKGSLAVNSLKKFKIEVDNRFWLLRVVKLGYYSQKICLGQNLCSKTHHVGEVTRLQLGTAGYLLDMFFIPFQCPDMEIVIQSST